MLRRSRVLDLFIVLLIYIVAYGLGLLSCKPVYPLILKYFVFDAVATVVTFIFSVLLKNSSVYDAYWSLTPMAMSIVLFIGNRAFSPFQLLFLLVFNLWSLRLTLNWISVFTDFSYEDWRYRKFREETPKPLWPVVNFFGIHFMPTLFVFGGFLPLFEIVKSPLGWKSVPGFAVMTAGILLEFFSDREMHAFLSERKGTNVCENGLWNYSRHPNYLGEITVWFGVFLSMLPYSMGQFYYGIGFLGIFLMFEVISIPLMENRQKKRRPSYADYCKRTSRLFLLPKKN